MSKSDISNFDIKKTLAPLIVFGFLVYLYPIWERTPGGFWLLPINLVILISFLWIIVRVIKELIMIFKIRNSLTLKALTPILTLTLGLLMLFTIQFNVEDTLYGKVRFRACYEGTQNQATFKLRENNRFEIHYTGVFFADEFVTGKYKLNADTLYLTYKNEIDERFGNKVFMDDSIQYLIPIKGDSMQRSERRNFYFGYCKGLN